MNSIDKLNLLHPKLRAAANLAYTEAVHATPVGVHPVIDQTYRTFEESKALYAQGRTTPGDIVTWALPGHSWHNYGLALDFHLVVDNKDIWKVDHNWMIVVNIFKGHGFNWGGEFPPVNGKDETDNPHLENKMGQTISGLIDLYVKKKFIPSTHYIDF